jgi:uncharacterized protein (DUF427 family)
MGSVRTEPIDKWVRGYVGATAVVDSRTPLLFWEETFPGRRSPDPTRSLDKGRSCFAGHGGAELAARVTVRLDGVELAETDRPVLLFETDLPTRYYVPRADVHFDVLTPSDNYSLCPYKGEAHEYWSAVGPPVVPNVAWSYWAPLPAVQRVAGMVAFYNELVDLTVDGEAQERPVSPSSRAAQRPGS